MPLLNNLMSLTFSSRSEVSLGPRRTILDCKTVSRRNIFGGVKTRRNHQSKFGILSRLDYDARNGRRQSKTKAGFDQRKSPGHRPRGWTMLLANRRVENAWQRLEQQGAPPAELLSADIYDSWMRCISHGLDTLRPPSPEFVSPACPTAGAAALLARARPCARRDAHPAQQIAGSNFMIAFATAGGLLLDIISDSSFSDASDAACIRAGAVWTENVCGTNGLGTAAYLKRPIVVHGREHFFARYNNLTCVAAPIFAPDGELTGILDASSDCMSRQAHTQALVAMAATQIENGLFREQHRGNILVAFHNRGEYLHTLAQACWPSTMKARSSRQTARRASCCTDCRPRRDVCLAMSSARNSVRSWTRDDARSDSGSRTMLEANSSRQSRTPVNFR